MICLGLQPTRKSRVVKSRRTTGVVLFGATTGAITGTTTGTKIGVAFGTTIVSCEAVSLCSFIMMLYGLLPGICNDSRQWCGHCRGR